jgi:hypothetical protein
VSGAATSGAITGAITASSLAGTLAMALVGADGYTWDCWKPVVMDESSNTSGRIMLHDLLHHPNIREVVVNEHGTQVKNIRDEEFLLSLVSLSCSSVCH